MGPSVKYEDLLTEYQEHIRTITHDLMMHKALWKIAEKENAELQAENARLKAEAVQTED